MSRTVERLLSLYPSAFQEAYGDDIREGIAGKIIDGDRREIRREYLALAARAPVAWLTPLQDSSSVGDIRSWIRIGFIAVFALFLLTVVGSIDAFGIVGLFGIPLAIAATYMGWSWLVLLGGLTSATGMFTSLLVVDHTPAQASWFIVPVFLATVGAAVASGGPRLSRAVLGVSPMLLTASFVVLGLREQFGPLATAVLIVYLYGLWRLPAAAVGMWVASVILIVPTSRIWADLPLLTLYVVGSGLLILARVAGDPEIKKTASAPIRRAVQRFSPRLERVRAWVAENL